MTLVGRDAPLAELVSALAAARGGRGRLVVVSGEAGIGKSALVDALAERAPVQFTAVQGFWDGASAKVGAMLLGRDVGEPGR